MKRHILSLFLMFTSAQAGKPQQPIIPTEKIATFKVVQQIFVRTHEVAEQLKNCCELSITEAPIPSCTEDQTAQGIQLFIRTYPRFLKTPWGRINLFTNAAHDHPNCFNTPTELLLEKIGATHLENLSDWPYEKKDAVLKNKIRIPAIGVNGDVASLRTRERESNLKEIPGEIYTVTHVDDLTCPPVIACPKENFRSHEELAAEWQLLQKMFKNGSRVTTPSTKTSPTSSKTSPGRISPKVISKSLGTSSIPSPSAYSSMTTLLNSLPTPEPSSSRPNSPSVYNSSTLTSPVIPQPPVTPTDKQQCSLM